MPHRPLRLTQHANSSSTTQRRSFYLEMPSGDGAANKSLPQSTEPSVERSLTFNEIAAVIDKHSSFCCSSLFFKAPEDILSADTTKRPEWMDSHALEQLVFIENLTHFVERYDFPAWQGDPTDFRPSHLGVMCATYVPKIADVTRDTFPQDAPEQTEHVRVFIEVCEEMRQAGQTLIDWPTTDPSSTYHYCNRHNILVSSIRDKLRSLRTTRAQ